MTACARSHSFFSRAGLHTTHFPAGPATCEGQREVLSRGIQRSNDHAEGRKNIDFIGQPEPTTTSFLKMPRCWQSVWVLHVKRCMVVHCSSVQLSARSLTAALSDSKGQRAKVGLSRITEGRENDRNVGHTSVTFFPTKLRATRMRSSRFSNAGATSETRSVGSPALRCHVQLPNF